MAKAKSPGDDGNGATSYPHHDAAKAAQKAVQDAQRAVAAATRGSRSP
jgi:hypothetical protein